MLIGPKPTTATLQSEVLDPALAALVERLDVRSRRVLAGKLQGERRSKRRGRSVEFEDYRQYAPGDDLRHIDWHAYARLDRFFIKVFQEEEDLCVHLVLDASASMLAGSPGKLLVGARLLAALGCLALTSNNRVGLMVMGLPSGASATLPGTSSAGVRVLPPTRGRTGVQRLVQALCESIDVAQDGSLSQGTGAVQAQGAGPGPGAGESFAQALKQLAAGAQGAGGGAGVAIVASDLLIPGVPARPRSVLGGQAPASAEAVPGYLPGLKYLAGSAAPGFDALIVQVLTPGELDPARELSGPGVGGPGGTTARSVVTGDVRLLDAETARGLELTVNAEALKAYRQRAARFVQEAGATCTKLGLRHTLLTTDANVSDFVLGPLRRTGVLT